MLEIFFQNDWKIIWVGEVQVMSWNQVIDTWSFITYFWMFGIFHNKKQNRII